MGPIWEGLKEHWACTDALFINVNVRTDPYIAELNDISTTPTFATFKSGRVVDVVRGGNKNAIIRMVWRHAKDAVSPVFVLPADAKLAKAEGSAAVAAGDYAHAVECYTRALALAPHAPVLYGSRAFAYIKLARVRGTPEEERRALGENAMRDARCATTLDERWVKGWIRLAEAAQLVAECENDPTPERAAARRMQLMAAHRAAEMVASLSSEKSRAGEYPLIRSRKRSHLLVRPLRAPSRCAEYRTR